MSAGVSGKVAVVDVFSCWFCFAVVAGGYGTEA